MKIVKITSINYTQILASIILIIGWVTGHVDGWIVIPVLLAMCDIKHNFN